MNDLLETQTPRRLRPLAAKPSFSPNARLFAVTGKVETGTKIQRPRSLKETRMLDHDIATVR